MNGYFLKITSKEHNKEKHYCTVNKYTVSTKAFIIVITFVYS